MLRRLRIVVVLLVGLIVPVGCGGSGPGYGGLPERPGAVGGPAPRGHIAYQPPLLPIVFSIDTDGKISVTLNSRLVTALGTVTVGAGVVENLAGKSLAPQPPDVTQLIICQAGSIGRRCQAYEIGTGRKIHISMNGSFVQDVERNRITIEAASGSTIKLTDKGPPVKLEAFGPARADVEEFHFNETGEETDVDLEKSRSGIATDLSYDHVTANLKPIHGAKVSTYATYSWTKPSARNDYPSEQECIQRRSEDWKDIFDEDDLGAKRSIFCMKTAEGDIGFLFIEPDSSQKPVAYYVYTYTWVR